MLIIKTYLKSSSLIFLEENTFNCINYPIYTNLINILVSLATGGSYLNMRFCINKTLGSQFLAFI